MPHFSRSQGVLPGDGSPGSKAWLAIKIWAWPPHRLPEASPQLAPGVQPVAQDFLPCLEPGCSQPSCSHGGAIVSKGAVVTPAAPLEAAKQAAFVVQCGPPWGAAQRVGRKAPILLGPAARFPTGIHLLPGSRQSRRLARRRKQAKAAGE